ncbi:FAD-dependent monooxygenase [Hyphomonas sp.]|uniref:FAD-dependent monooxygenase n=1 Tax=Hyphomonas sp. TaxID=87 RepID=UPI003527EF1D
MADRVIIVGAGPVGMTLALDLARRGVPSLILEQRDADAPAHPKCNTISARSMEIFDILGCADDMREVGLPADYTNDVVYSTSYANGHEIARLSLPSRARRWSDDRFALDGEWPSAQRPHRASQIFLERVLRKHVLANDMIELRFSSTVVAADEQADGVVVSWEEGGDTHKVKAPYVAGCDGGRSFVRRAMDVSLVGISAVKTRIWAAYFRSKKLLKAGPKGGVWMNFFIQENQRGTLVAIDGIETWLIHCNVPPGLDYDEFDWRAGVGTLLGADVDFDLIAAEKWRLNRAVAEKYRAGRFFLAGDAAHIWPPFAGFGMNSGVEDAFGLSWMLAAVLKGQASEQLLDAYEAERKPVGELVSHAADGMVAEQRAAASAGGLQKDVRRTDKQGELARTTIGRNILRIDSQQFDPQGLNFGIAYESSPAVVYDGEAAPAFVVRQYTPTTVPGCRAPYFVFADGVHLYERLGPDLTLLRTNPDVDVSAFVDAAKERRVGLKVIDIGHEPKARPIYDRALVLVRHDQRICWRGETADEAGTVLAQILGERSGSGS